MKLSKEIQAQIDFLKLPSTEWVKNSPAKPNQACAVVRYPESAYGRVYVPICSLTPSERDIICAVVAKTYNLAKARTSDIMNWNDSRFGARSKEEVISCLKEIRDKLIEADL